MTRNVTRKMGLRRFVRQARRSIDSAIKHELGDVEIKNDDDRVKHICGTPKLRSRYEGFNIVMPELEQSSNA